MAKFDFGWDEFDPETFMPLTLKQDVERGSALHPADALNLAEALDTLGSYDKGK